MINYQDLDFGLTIENSAVVDFIVLPENFSHQKRIHLDTPMEDVKKAMEIELGIAAHAQTLMINGT